MAQASEPVVLERCEGGIAHLTLNRPKAYNSLSRAMLEALEASLARIRDSAEVRVVVISGNGKAFCAGHDLKEMGADLSETAIEALFAHCSRMMLALTRLPQPVIAKVDGMATAAGCQLVAACDLAVCTDESRFATSGVKYGLFCSTPMVALSRNIPRKPAMEMLLTGDFIDAHEAHRAGLVNEVVAKEGIEEAVAALVGRLLDKPADILALGKRAFYRQLEMGLEAAYAFTTEVITENAQRPAFAEGLDAFINKRPPVWPER